MATIQVEELFRDSMPAAANTTWNLACCAILDMDLRVKALISYGKLSLGS